MSDREYASKGPDLLLDLGEHTADVLRSLGIDDDKAHQAAHEVVDRMRGRWGGHLVYFPQGVSMDIEERDIDLWDAFDGHNHEALARPLRHGYPDRLPAHS